MLAKKLTDILAKREFLSVATCDFEGRPNAASKFLLKVDGNTLYMVDYTIGMTYQNLKLNPRASISFIDPVTLEGYQLNGPVEIIDKGAKFDKLCGEMRHKTIKLTTQHIIDDVRGKAKHESFEIVITDNFVVLAVKVEDIAEIGIRGELTRKKSI